MSDERKTLEQREQMTDIERLRHSASHVLATAILKIWPEAQFAAGPPVENGFYYDVDLPHRISPDDFDKIEAEMKNEIKANHQFERMEWRPYFEAVEGIMRDYDGRPHWGKRHFQSARTLAALYPRWDAFQRARAELDPDGTFRNGYSARVLG